jgi:hypothetical protein
MDNANNLTDREREILNLIEPGEALKESYRLEDGSIVTWQEVRNLEARSGIFKSKFSKQITDLFSVQRSPSGRWCPDCAEPLDINGTCHGCGSCFGKGAK